MMDFARAQPILRVEGVGGNSLYDGLTKRNSPTGVRVAQHASRRVKQVDPSLVELEDERRGFCFDGMSSGGSPDRLGALVWAATEMAGRVGQGPRIRML